MSDVLDPDRADPTWDVGGGGAREAEPGRVLGMDLDELLARVEDEDAHEADVGADHDADNVVGEPVPVDVDEALADIEGALASRGPDSGGTGAWERYQRLLPAVARDLLLSCVRRDYVRDHLLERLHEEVLLRGVPAALRDAATVRAAWRDACRQDRLPETRRVIRRLRDEIVRVLHMGSANQHLRYERMPTFLAKWKPVGGVLRVTEVGRTVPSLGWSALLEATPPQVIRYVYETWLARRIEVADPSELVRRKPVAWDLTAGAGTGHDTLGLLGCEVRSSDLTAMNEVVGTLDARNFEALYRGNPIFTEADRRQRPVSHPDLVLFDPSSRGTPSNSSLYWPDAGGLGDSRDFAALDREAWIQTTTGIVRRLVLTVAPGGVVSFLVRHGVRNRGRVEPDDRLVADVREALGTDVVVVEEVRVQSGPNRVRQASLGVVRVPSTHLLVGRRR
jgi:hypothetical protein